MAADENRPAAHNKRVILTEEEFIKGIVVTGSSSGIGNQCVKYLASLNEECLIFACMRNTDSDSFDGEHVIKVSLDLENTTNIKKLNQIFSFYDDIVDEWILVSNAGISYASFIEDINIDELRNVFQVNLFGVIELIQVMLPRIKSTMGRIIFINSLTSYCNLPLLAAYSCSRSALSSLANVLRYELMDYDVNLSTVYLGPFKTKIWDKTISQLEKYKLEKSLNGVNKKIYYKVLCLINDISANGESPHKVSELIVEIIFNNRNKSKYFQGKWALGLYYLSKVLPDKFMRVMIKGFITS